jgi:hypothetical protein
MRRVDVVSGFAQARGVIPETRYAKSGDVHIAYQVIGEGPVDLVFVPAGLRMSSWPGTIPRRRRSVAGWRRSPG